MSRSSHATKQALRRERRFAAADGVPFGPQLTELEAEHIQKLLQKTNETFRRQASAQHAPGQTRLRRGVRDLERAFDRNRANNPNRNAA